MINKNSSNNELLEDPKFKEVLDSGAILVVDKQDSKNPKFQTLFLAQQVDIGGGNLNRAKTLLLGFGSQIQRCVQSVSVENAELVEIGSNLNELFDAEFSLQITDSLVPNPDFDHNPRKGKNRETGELETLVSKETGEPVYREAEITPTEDVSHSIIRTVLESQYEGKIVSKKRVTEAQS